MTFAPQPLKDLAAYWVAKKGVNSGIVGDAPHQATGTSYHLGKSQLRADAYSRVLARDKAGLSEAASAIDLGKLEGSLGRLQEFSTWLVEQCKAGAAGTRDIREVIWSPDGKVVRHWNEPFRQVYAGYPTATGHGDSSHLWHTHISFYRDSETREKVSLFAPFFEEADVPIFNPLHPETATVTPGTPYQLTPSGKVLGTISDGSKRYALLAFDAAPASAKWVALNGHAPGSSSEAGWVPVSSLRSRQPVPVVDCGPQIDAAVAAAVDRAVATDREKAHVSLENGEYKVVWL